MARGTAQHKSTKSAKLLNYIQFANIISINICLFKDPRELVQLRKENITICWETKQAALKQPELPLSSSLFKYQKALGSGYHLQVKICSEADVLQTEAINFTYKARKVTARNLIDSVVQDALAGISYFPIIIIYSFFFSFPLIKFYVAFIWTYFLGIETDREKKIRLIMKSGGYSFSVFWKRTSGERVPSKNCLSL